MNRREFLRRTAEGSGALAATVIAAPVAGQLLETGQGIITGEKIWA